jgi:hypothetical protein
VPAEFHDASVLALYLLPQVNLKLWPERPKESKAGARTVSHPCEMGDREPDEKIAIGWSTVCLRTVTREAPE